MNEFIKFRHQFIWLAIQKLYTRKNEHKNITTAEETNQGIMTACAPPKKAVRSQQCSPLFDPSLCFAELCRLKSSPLFEIKHGAVLYGGEIGVAYFTCIPGILRSCAGIRNTARKKECAACFMPT